MRQDLAISQLDDRLGRVEAIENPPGGWIKSIREALGMTTAQLARRLGVDQSMVVRHESREQRGGITVQKLQEIADALDCDLVYALKPRRPLKEMIRARALEKARALVGRVSHSMALEDQALSAQANEAETARLADELLREKWSKLWEE